MSYPPGESQDDDGGSGLFARVGVQLVASLGSVNDEIRKMRRDLARARADVPRDRRENFSAFPNNQFPAAGNLVLSLDGPTLGVLWEVRQITVGGAAATAAPAGTAYVFSGVSPPNDLSLVGLRGLTSGSLPQIATWGTGTFKVYRQQNLYVVIVGGTVGSTYAAYADIAEYPDTARMATVTVE